MQALIRLDPVGRGHARTDSSALAAAVLGATARASAPNPLPQGRPIRWGVRNQVDVVALHGRQGLAGYLAKYTVESVDSGGALDHRLDRVQLKQLAIDDHLRRLVQTCWDLGADPTLADCRLREWAHTLGFRGHWLTKSPNWSTSLTALRRTRHEYQLERAGRREDAITFGEWTYAGAAHQSEGDDWLAQNEAKSRNLNRRIAWEER